MTDSVERWLSCTLRAISCLALGKRSPPLEEIHLFGGDHSILVVVSSYQATVNRDSPKGWHSCMEWEKLLKHSPRMLTTKLDPAAPGGISTNSFCCSFPSFFVFLRLIFQLFSFFLSSLFPPVFPQTSTTSISPCRPFYVNTIFSSCSSVLLFCILICHSKPQSPPILLFSFLFSWVSSSPSPSSLPLTALLCLASKAVPLQGSREEVCTSQHQFEPWT